MRAGHVPARLLATQFAATTAARPSTPPPAPAPNGPEPDEFPRWLLVRRRVGDPEDLAYYLCAGRPGTTVEQLVRAAGTRWAVKEYIEIAKGEAGLDHYDVRSRAGWYRHVTLALFAQAMLAAIRAKLPPGPRQKKGRKGPPLIPLTVPEVGRLLLWLVWARLKPAERVLAQSAWRRGHQAKAGECHYKERQTRSRKGPARASK
jgi:hypothetical protein